jgi:hypothetical protein
MSSPATSPTTAPTASPTVSPITSPTSSTAKISGTVKSENGTPLAGVTLTLRNRSNNVVATTSTRSDGTYEFAGLYPGNYLVEETNPSQYLNDISDQDNSPDGDDGDPDKTVDNLIYVTLTDGEEDKNNDFVDAPTLSSTKSPVAVPTFSPTKAPVPPFSTPSTGSSLCVNFTIDFDSLPNGTSLLGGAYVSNEWFEVVGLTLSASGGYGDIPRLFNTSDVGNSQYGDTHLGSPNEKCDSSGPGIGSGGVPGTPGENCVPMGNVLIIQENNKDKSQPDDHASGDGVITFSFTSPVQFVYAIGLMDIEGNDTTITVVHDTASGQETTAIVVNGVGNNGFQTVPIEIGNVSELKVNFYSSGAVAFINFCHQLEESAMPSEPPSWSPAPSASPSDSVLEPPNSEYHTTIDVLFNQSLGNACFGISKSSPLNDMQGNEVITFDFASSVEGVNDIHLALPAGGDSLITIMYDDGIRKETSTIVVIGNGKASEKCVNVNKEKVYRMEVKLPHSGAVSSLNLRVNSNLEDNSNRRVLEEEPMGGLPQSGLMHTHARYFERKAASPGDVFRIPTDKCTASDFQDPVTILSQEKETVTFSISQVWKGCSTGRETLG